MEYKKQWGYMLCPTRYPNIYRLQKGGFLGRVRFKDPLTAKEKTITRVLDAANEVEALQLLDQAKSRTLNGSVGPAKTLFSEFAAELFERKIQRGDIRSVVGADKWKNTLKHLIAGTTVKGVHVAGLGDCLLEELRPAHIERWKDGLAAFLASKAYAPTTLNSWLTVLRVISKAAAREYEMRDFMAGVENFNTEGHFTYSEEEPNALSPEVVADFLSEMRRKFPQHYAMVFLGMATGLRPSSLRPLRRRGANADVLWEEGRLRVRQSQTRGTKVLEGTKTGTRYSIHLPQEVVDVLRWHVETQLRTGEMQDSDLLFPAIGGGFRTRTALRKPFMVVAEAVGVKHNFTPRGMRRTFQDLARVAEVSGLVTRSVSGHATTQMQDHYSSVSGTEQRAGLAKVIQFARPRSHQNGEKSGVSEMVNGVKIDEGDSALSAKSP